MRPAGLGLDTAGLVIITGDLGMVILELVVSWVNLGVKNSPCATHLLKNCDNYDDKILVDSF